MSFWNDTTPEPLRQYRWYIVFNNNGLNENRYALKSCDKPSFDVNITEHILLNNVYKYPGVLKWKPINVKMASTRNRNGQLSLSSVLQNFVMNIGGYQPNNTATEETVGAVIDVFATTEVLTRPFLLNPGISKTFSSLPLGFKLDIKQIDGDGKTIETWTLHNPFISNIDYGKLDYGSEEIVDINFTLNYDYATLSKEA